MLHQKYLRELQIYKNSDIILFLKLESHLFHCDLGYLGQIYLPNLYEKYTCPITYDNLYEKYICPIIYDEKNICPIYKQ